MLKTWQKCVLIFGLVFCSSSLVHELTLPTWEEGCIGYTKELQVGESEKDPSVCGLLVCMNADGRGQIYFCQQPAAFQHCDNNTVNLAADYPDCCWQCTEAVACDA